MQCKSNDNISATKYKHASSLVSHKTVKSRKIAMKKWQIVQRASRLTRLTGISSRLLLPFPPFPDHHSHSHEFSLCFPFPWDSHETHGNSRIMHTSSVDHSVAWTASRNTNVTMRNADNKKNKTSASVIHENARPVHITKHCAYLEHNNVWSKKLNFNFVIFAIQCQLCAAPVRVCFDASARLPFLPDVSPTFLGLWQTIRRASCCLTPSCFKA